MLGKEFMIVVVVVFSALSFTLGYFVGKSGTDGGTANLSRAQEIVPLPQKQEPAVLPLAQDIPVPENALLDEEKDKEHLQPQRDEVPAVVETKEAGPAKSLQPGKEKTRAQAASKQVSEEAHQKAVVKKNSADRESKKPDGPVYTVQIGAFKSSGEAESCRKKLAKNKLKTYVITATNSKKEKIFKVRTGEFSDRKSAEVLALKLSKTEKLKTFVTIKNG